MPHEPLHLRIFVSSPGDVGQERRIAEKVIDRLDAEFGDVVVLSPYFWEYEPFVITADYQEQIPPPSTFDIFICILWSRLGSRLSSKYTLPPDHQRPAESGTEYEFVDAKLAYDERKCPEILVWVNKTKITIDADDPNFDELKHQRDALKAFLERWTRSDTERTFSGAINRYTTRDEFEESLESKLRKLIKGRLGLRAEELQSRPRWPGNPYRGLSVFEYRHAPIFFGRTAAISEAIDRLRDRLHQLWREQEEAKLMAESGMIEASEAPNREARAFLLIFGASGSGKSSLARAGLLPMLAESGAIEGVGEWRCAIMKPSDGGANLMLSLASALVRSKERLEPDRSSDLPVDLPNPALQPAALPELLSDGESIATLAKEFSVQPESAAVRIAGAVAQVSAVLAERERNLLVAAIDRDRKNGRIEDAAAQERRLADQRPRRVCLALIIDQLEELFTSDTKNDEHLTTFFRAIDAVAASGRAVVVATLRSDFFADCEGNRGFQQILMNLKDDRGTFHLKAPQRHEFGQIIRKPAQAAGVRFEESTELGTLDDRIRDAALGDPESLPLLQFCMERLYEIGSSNGVLEHAEYGIDSRTPGIGQLHGVLTQHAESVYSGLEPEAQASMRHIILALAKTGGNHSNALNDQGIPSPSAIVRRVVPYDSLTVLGDGDQKAHAKALIDRFVEARLFTASVSSDGEKTISVTHESLLKRWDRVSVLLSSETSQRFLRVREQIEDKYSRWLDSNRNAGLLLQKGPELNDAVEQVQLHSQALAPELSTFIQESIEFHRLQERRHLQLRNRVIATLGFLLLAAIISTVLAFEREREAVIQRDLNEARSKLTTAKVLLESDPESALPLALEGLERELAVSKQVAPASLSDFLTVTNRSVGKTFSPIWSTKTPPLASSLSVDGERILVAYPDQIDTHLVSAIDDDITTPSSSVKIEGTRKFASSQDARVFAVETDSGGLDVWASDPWRKLCNINLGDERITNLRVLSSKSLVLAIIGGGTLRGWDLKSGTIRFSKTVSAEIGLTIHTSEYSRIAVINGGSTFGGGSLEIFDLESHELRSYNARGSESALIAVSRDGSSIFLATPDGHISRYLTAEGFVRDEQFEATFSGIEGLDCSSSEDVLIIRLRGGQLNVVDFSGRLIRPEIHGHRAVVMNTAHVGSRRELVSLDRNGIMGRWNMAGLEVVPPIAHYSPVRTLLLSSDRKLLAVGLTSGAVVIHDVEHGSEVHRLETGAPVDFLIEIDPGESFVAASSLTNTLTKAWFRPGTKEVRSELRNLSDLTGDGIRGLALSTTGIYAILNSRDFLKLSRQTLLPLNRWVLPRIVPVTSMGVLETVEEGRFFFAAPGFRSFIRDRNGDISIEYPSEKISEKWLTRNFGITVSATDRMIATSSRDQRQAVVVDLIDFKEISNVRFSSKNNLTASAFASGDGYLVAGFADGGMQFSQASTGISLGPVYSLHKGKINAIAIDGEERRLIYTGGEDGFVRVSGYGLDHWVQTGKQQIAGDFSFKNLGTAFKARTSGSTLHTDEEAKSAFILPRLEELTPLDPTLIGRATKYATQNLEMDFSRLKITHLYSSGGLELNPSHARGVCVFEGIDQSDPFWQLNQFLRASSALWGKFDYHRFGVVSRVPSSPSWNEGTNSVTQRYDFLFESGDQGVLQVWMIPNQERLVCVMALGNQEFQDEFSLRMAEAGPRPNIALPEAELRTFGQIVDLEIKKRKERAKAGAGGLLASSRDDLKSAADELESLAKEFHAKRFEGGAHRSMMIAHGAELRLKDGFYSENWLRVFGEARSRAIRFHASLGQAEDVDRLLSESYKSIDPYSKFEGSYSEYTCAFSEIVSAETYSTRLSMRTLNRPNVIQLMDIVLSSVDGRKTLEDQHQARVFLNFRSAIVELIGSPIDFSIFVDETIRSLEEFTLETPDPRIMHLIGQIYWAYAENAQLNHESEDFLRLAEINSKHLARCVDTFGIENPWDWRLARSLALLGEAQKKNGRVPESRKSYLEAVAIMEKSRVDPTVGEIGKFMTEWKRASVE